MLFKVIMATIILSYIGHHSGLPDETTVVSLKWIRGLRFSISKSYSAGTRQHWAGNVSQSKPKKFTTASFKIMPIAKFVPWLVHHVLCIYNPSKQAIKILLVGYKLSTNILKPDIQTKCIALNLDDSSLKPPNYPDKKYNIQAHVWRSQWNHSRASLTASQLKTPGCISADWARHAVLAETKPTHTTGRQTT